VWPALSLLFSKLGHCGGVGQAYLLCPEIDASTYAATRPMTFLACRTPRFSTIQGKFFWQTEMKFVACGIPNFIYGYLATSSEPQREISRIIGRFAWFERIGSSDLRALPGKSIITGYLSERNST